MEFYEEALSLVFDLTSKKISADLWKVLEIIYQVNLMPCKKIEIYSLSNIFRLLGVRERRF